MSDQRIVVEPRIYNFDDLRFTGQTAFDVRAGGTEVPASIPDHAQLWASDVEVKTEVVGPDTMRHVLTFKNPQWFVPQFPSEQAPAIPADYMQSSPGKCADLSDRAILEFLAQHQGRWSTHGVGHSMPTVADAMPKDTPVKLQLAKMRQLLKRDLVGGCPCGCRGDWEITDAGLAYIGQPRTKGYTKS